MSISVDLVGGPPWGLRVGHDEELRPVVAKILPGGRACVTGIKIGDWINEVNGVPVETASQAHNAVQGAKGNLHLTLSRQVDRGQLSQIFRSTEGFHQTVIREKLSSSCHNSPVVDRKKLVQPTSSVPSSPAPLRANALFKQIRLDVQGVKGSADNKRRLFEQLCANSHPPTTDSLLRRKIQLGCFERGVPSESTTGYESVPGDYAFGQEGHSGRTSPLSSLMSNDEEEEKTLHEEGQHNNQIQLAEKAAQEKTMFAEEEMGIASPGPSQWTVKTENHGTAPAEGAIVVPGRRSVAALRQAITDKLEMKSPTAQGGDGRRTPSWNNVKVFEGVDEEPPNKPTFGRVLDGPVAPTKYYQGVPPPSYYINTAISPVHSKPPLPPSVPPKPPKPSVDLTNDFDSLKRNSFLNSIATRAEDDAPSPAPSDVSSNPYYQNYYGREDEPMSVSLMTASITTEPGLETAPEDPSSTVEPPADPLRRGSMDLESSQLLKSKSPSPYSSTSADHYATIRRIPTPVRLDVDETPPATRKTFSYSTATNDSGYGDAISPRDGLNFDAYSTNSTVPASSTEQTFDLLSSESSRPERPESLLSFSTVDGEAPAADKDEIAPLRPVSNEPEMSTWYKNMFKKMHKLDPSADSVLRHQLREGSPSVSSTISRPLTPTSCISRPPSRFECEITPRRARSVGRVIEPADKAAFERSRTTHFHLPSYAFRDEDPRALLCGCTSSKGISRSCLRCGRPRKTPSWSEIDYLYKTLGKEEVRKEGHEQRLQSRVSRRAISDRLDQTTRELESFLADLVKTNEKEESPAPPQIAEEIAELKRLSKEELMLRQKAERLQEELEEQRQRRHGYLPSAAPALQKNFDRFEGLLNDYGKDNSPAPSSGRSRSPGPVIRTATAVYKFIPKSPREMPLNKGDVVRINRQVDSNWLEGERNGKCGIFPASYVQINNETDNRQKMRAVYPFTARNSNEMSLKIGEIVTWRREIDQNWSEGANHIGEIGIFPKCYVRPMEEEMDTPGSVIPARPKTPKITFEAEHDDERTVTFDPVLQMEPVKAAEPPPREQPRSQPPVQQEPYRREVPISYPREEPPRVGRHSAFDEDTPIGYMNGYKENTYKENSYKEKPVRDTRPNGAPPPSKDTKSSSWAGGSLANLIPRGSEMFRVAYAYAPQKEDELELHVDDIVFVVEKCDDGWFIGTSLRDGQFGTFPGNYCVRH